MPLAFHSESHGTVAFGFFQIEIDMLLLDRLFFFANDFCSAVVELTAEGRAGATLDGFVIDEPRMIGDLHGAIAGVDLGGFIGATYRRFPFPKDAAAFKQNPAAEENRAWAFELIREFGRAHRITLRRVGAEPRIAIGEYVFREAEFQRLIAYVDRGGHPRWKDDVRPLYVREMMKALGRRAQAADDLTASQLPPASRRRDPGRRS